MADPSQDNAREEILARVRRKLGVRGDEPGRRGKVRFRLTSPRANLIPERAQKARTEAIKLFQAMLQKSGAKASRVRSLRVLPDAIAAALKEQNLPLQLRAGDDPILAALPADGPLEFLSGPAAPNDAVSLSRAAGAAAETGTLFFLSGAENPSTLNFLPETHCAIILAEDIVGSHEEVWAKIRARYGAGVLPRMVNLISGPSCTSGIGQTIAPGGHGPKNLVVFIIG